MNIIKQIKAEIERLYNGEAPKHDQQCNFDDGYFTGIDAIAQFIDTLESEKPSKELEEEIKRWWGEQYMKNSEGLPILPVVQGIARYFAKWGEHNALEHLRAARRTEEAYQEVAKEMRKQIAESGSSEIPNDLEEAAVKYADETYYAYPLEFLDFVKEEIRDAFNAGAEWQKEQMMSEAVEGVVHHYGNVHWIVTDQGELAARLKQFRQDEKVRLVIVKE